MDASFSLARRISRIPLGIGIRHAGGVPRWIVLIVCLLAASTVVGQTNPPASVLIEVAGPVEWLAGGTTNWQRAEAGLELGPGAKVRTAENARAALRLSDLSVVRLDQRTTLELLPPRRAEKRRFGLPSGVLYFFNRERPADVEFDTPLASGAIRGTEFLLDATEVHLRLALIDGRVALRSATGETALERGQELRLEPGQPARVSLLVDAVAPIQWALYYPAVVAPGDLVLTTAEAERFQPALQHYAAGDLFAALGALPANAQEESPDAMTFRAALGLAVGRVAEAERSVAGLDRPAARALRDLIATVQGRSVPSVSSTLSASEALARSFAQQAKGDLVTARKSARDAGAAAPGFGLAHARLAELEWAFGRRVATADALEAAARLSPRFAPAPALRGFVALERSQLRAAHDAFAEAVRLDAAYGPAWLGLGLVRMREGDRDGARAAFQTAAALEPQRGLFRAYLGKASGEAGDAVVAHKELALAQRLDPGEPTGWFYAALEHWQQNRLNTAIRELEAAADRNDQRAVFRSRLRLDSDQAVRSANLAALYAEAGLTEVARQAAARAVAQDPSEFAAHLFLAQSHRAAEDRNRFDLRLEPARHGELLLANLLAPVGAGNLSQLLDQQDHLRFFEPRPVGGASATEYSDNGDLRQRASVFGAVDGLGYAVDAYYEKSVGERPNQDAERRQFIATTKHRLADDDELYFQISDLRSDTGDVANHLDPASAKTALRAVEEQSPTVHLGWHHAWSAGSHTLLHVSRIDDALALHDEEPNLIFVRRNAGGVVEVQAPPAGPPFTLDQSSDVALWTAELQQILRTEAQTLVVGARGQLGNVDTRATLQRGLSGVVTDQSVDDPIRRAGVYAYETWHLSSALHLTAGLAYDHLEHPENSELPPLADGTRSRDLVSPKAGLIWEPWRRGAFRAGYARSLGGALFDASERLEPTQVGGFNQAYRSLLPESVGGLVPGARFDTAGVGFDQSFARGTWFGVEGLWLSSDGERTAGVLTNSIPFLALADAPSGTRQTVNFRERSLSAYVGQLLGEHVSLGVRYRVGEAEWTGEFPELPAGTPGLAGLRQDERAVLHELALTAGVQWDNGLFGRWESAWFHQRNEGGTAGLAGDDFWQHHVTVGYRLPRRRAEIRCSLLNLFDQDYRLNPLNLHAALPRGRTFVLGVRVNF